MIGGEASSQSYSAGGKGGMGGGNVSVGEMQVEFVRDTNNYAVGGGPVGSEIAPVSTAEPLYWWKTPFLYLYVVAPAGPHDHKVHFFVFSPPFATHLSCTRTRAIHACVSISILK
jgi:hypothetical protein